MSTKYIAIPDSAEKVLKAMTQNADLLHVKEWEQAALLYPLIAPGVGGSRQLAKTSQLTCRQFAEKGIRGLRSKDTVSRYWMAMNNAIKADVAEVPTLGGRIKLPDAEWSDYFPPYEVDKVSHELVEDYAEAAAAEGTGLSSAIRVGRSKAALTAAIKADPAVRLAAREAIQEHDRQRKPIIDPRGQEPDPIDTVGGLLLTLRVADRKLQEALAMVLEVRGLMDTAELRDGISERMRHLRQVLDAIDEAAQGRSMDEELQRILEAEL